MKKFILVTLFFVFNSHAAEHIWSGVGSSCGDTLGLCVDSVSDGDTIYIQTNAPIDENISFLKTVSLIAAEGYHPVFVAGRKLHFGIDRNIVISGLTLNGGTIEILNMGSFSGNDVIATIAHNSINSNNRVSINIARNEYSTASPVGFLVNIKDNALINTNTSTTSFREAILIENNSNDSIRGDITNNTIESLAISLGACIYSNNRKQGTNFLNITGNICRFTDFGFKFDDAFMNGSLTYVNAFSNFLYNPIAQGGFAINQYVNTNSNSTLNLVNNTIFNTETAILAQELDGSINQALYNNLISDVSHIGIELVGMEAGDSGGNANIMYTNGGLGLYTNYIPGADDILVNTAPPANLFTSLSDGHLLAGSQALAYADPTGISLVSDDVPYIDADGLHRSRNGGVDVGAFELADDLVTSLSTDNDFSYSFISGLPELDVAGNAAFNNIFITPNLYIGGQNNHNEALFNLPDTYWGIINKDSENMAKGATFNLMQINDLLVADGSNVFQNTSVISNTYFTTINHGLLSGHADKVLQVTQIWDIFAGDDANDNPIGVRYNPSSGVSGRWEIVNMTHRSNEVAGAVDMPLGTKFNVYFQDESNSAWKHEVTAGNRSGNRTYLNNLLINDQPCAQLQVTQEVVPFFQSGLPPVTYYNSSPIGVDYEVATGRWLIVNQNGSTMPIGAKFHIIVNPKQIEQTSSCPIQTVVGNEIFTDGFE